jgi:subtilase family serine protease
VAIVDAYDDPYALSDLNAYSTHWGIPTMASCPVSSGTASSPCFQKVNENGGSTPPATDGLGINGWAGEISLDLDAVHAMCQNCNILLVEADAPTDTDLIVKADQTAVSMGANVVSNSWGGSESSGDTAYNSYFNHPGVPFVFSTGDNGYGVQYPSASPNVTAVGGTALYVNSDNTYNSESAWDGAGSGCSAYESKPSFQHDSGCTHRTVADVSADADPNTGASVVYNGSYYQFGGTSLAAPLVASVFALGGGVGSTLGNSLPYANLNYGVNLRDVTSGSTGSCGGSYLCTGTSGYDGPTGLGTPRGFTAFKSNATTGPTPIAPSGTISDTTPTFTWTKVSGATQYQFAVYSGTTLKYSKIVASSACGTNCSNTPTTVLSAGSYKWEVRAYVSSAWKPYSAFKNFTLVVANGNPKAGFWQGMGGAIGFYVTPAQNYVKKFAVNISVPGCGSYKITSNLQVPISNKHFAFTGAFYGSGTFSSATVDSGKTGLSHLLIGGCGYVSGGPWSYSAAWKNSTQASAPISTVDYLVTNLGLSDGLSGFYQAVQVDAP